MTDRETCSICLKPYEGFGNNAYPVNEGRCCDECNRNVVLPVRMRRMSDAEFSKGAEKLMRELFDT